MSRMNSSAVGGDPELNELSPTSTAPLTQANTSVFSVNGRTGVVTLTPADVGLSNVELSLGNPSQNGYLLSSTIAGVRSWRTLTAADIASGTIAQARLGTGSDGSGTHFLADDQTYKTVAAASFGPQTANTGLFGPVSGAPGLPTFRMAVAADVPSLPESQITNLTSDLSARALTSRQIITTSPIIGGGDLSADRTISMPVATTSVNGYLSSADWTTFNSKEPAIASGTTSQYWRGDKTFQTLNSAAAGLGNVTNDVQTKAAIVPNTVPTAGQIHAGNAGGTAFGVVTVSGSGATISMSSAGVITISAIPNATLSNSSVTIAGTSTALGGSITADTILGLSGNGFVKRTAANTYTNDTSSYLTGNQTITLSGDVTGSGAISITTVVQNIPTATTMAGRILATNIVAPATPAAGKTSIYVDSTSKNIAAINDAGTINHGSQTISALASNWLSGHNDDGSWTRSSPAFTDITGVASSVQIPVGAVNTQTVSYTLLAADSGKLVTFNGSNLTATLPASPPNANWNCYIGNLNSTSLTISRNALTINGGTSNITLPQYSMVRIFTDNSNYFSQIPLVAGTGITLTPSSNGISIAVGSLGFSNLTGNIATTQMNSGTSASSSTYWRGDGTWATPAGAGTVTSVATTSPLSGGPITSSGTISLLVNVDFAFTAAQTITLAPAVNTAATGLLLTDTTAASAGNQQYSGALRFTGQGWKTNATAASQAVDFRAYVIPVQGAVNPTGYLTLESQINAGGFGNGFNFFSSGGLAMGSTSDPGAQNILTTGTLTLVNGVALGTVTQAALVFSTTGYSIGAGVRGFLDVYNNTAVLCTSAAELKLNTGQKITFKTSGDANRDDATATTGISEDAAGGVQFNTGTPGQWGYGKMGVRDAGTTTVTRGLILGHQSTATPAAGFGTGILFNVDSSTTADQNAGQIGVAWSIATHATRTSYFDCSLVNNAGALASVMRLFASGGLSVNATTDPGAGIINANTGFQVTGVAVSGNYLRGNGTNFVSSAIQAADLPGGIAGLGNPTATVGTTAVNGTATTAMRSDGAPALNLTISPTWTGVHTFSPTARSSGVAAYLVVNIPADTAQTAATESIGIKTVTATRQWATTGTVALQRENFLAGPTYSSVSASQTFTDTFTLYLTPPIAGTNAIFTRGHTLGIVDSTSAASSITGGLVVSTTIGTTATSVGIGGGNINAGGTLIVGGHVTFEGVTSAGATGTGNLVFATAPTLGVVTVTSINKMGVTAPTTAATLAFGTDNATITFQGTDTYLGRATTDTLTNKRITKRTGTATSSATPTINTDNVDFYSLTAQAVDITSFTTNLTGTPTEGQTLWLAITGTAARLITWGTSFEASTIALPTTTVTTARLDVGFVWNTVTSKWRCVATC